MALLYSNFGTKFRCGRCGQSAAFSEADRNHSMGVFCHFRAIRTSQIVLPNIRFGSPKSINIWPIFERIFRQTIAYNHFYQLCNNTGPKCPESALISRFQSTIWQCQCIKSYIFQVFIAFSCYYILYSLIITTIKVNSRICVYMYFNE